MQVISNNKYVRIYNVNCTEYLYSVSLLLQHVVMENLDT